MGTDLWSAQTLLAFAVPAGFLSGIVGFAVNWLGTTIKRKLDAKYVAVEVATELEKYAIACWSITQMHKGHLTAYGEMASLQLPDSPALQWREEWKVLSPTFVDDIMSFMNETHIEDSSAQYAKFYEANDFDYWEAAERRGFAAWLLAERVRQAHGLPQRYKMRAKIKSLFSNIQDARPFL